MVLCVNMGLFNLHVYSREEMDLIEAYTMTYEGKFGISEREARKMAKRSMDRAIKKAKEEKVYDLPPNLYGIMYEGEKPKRLHERMSMASITPEDLRKALDPIIQEVREEGVSEEEIRDWYNQSRIRQLMQMEYEMVDYGQKKHKLLMEDPGLSDEQAAEVVCNHNPIFLVLDSYTERMEGSYFDKPLFMGLRTSARDYCSRLKSEQGDDFEDMVERNSSMNALIRLALQDGSYYT